MKLQSRFLTPAVPKLDGGYTYSFCRLRHHWRGLALVSPVLQEDDVRLIFQVPECFTGLKCLLSFTFSYFYLCISEVLHHL